MFIFLTLKVGRHCKYPPASCEMPWVSQCVEMMRLQASGLFLHLDLLIQFPLSSILMQVPAIPIERMQSCNYHGSKISLNVHLVLKIYSLVWCSSDMSPTGLYFRHLLHSCWHYLGRLWNSRILDCFPKEGTLDSKEHRTDIFDTSSSLGLGLWMWFLTPGSFLPFCFQLCCDVNSFHHTVVTRNCHDGLNPSETMSPNKISLGHFCWVIWRQQCKSN